MNRDDEIDAVESLSNDDSGAWLVTTQDSVYVLDLDDRLTYRMHERGRPRMQADVHQELLMLVNCKVGEVGYWVTCLNGNPFTQLPHRTGIIRSIRRTSSRTVAEAAAEVERRGGMEGKAPASIGESRSSLEPDVAEIARDVEAKSAVLNERLSGAAFEQPEHC